jgi:hypothetical protein
MSQIDGCVPLFVSPDTLISTLDLIMARNVRVIVVGDAKCPVISQRSRDSNQPEIKIDKVRLTAPNMKMYPSALAPSRNVR